MRRPRADQPSWRSSSPAAARRSSSAGRFGSLNGVTATGVGALDATTGATRPFAVNQLITNQGVNSAVYSLTSDGDTVYGTGYDVRPPGNLEGAFAAAADGGALRWINDCHGDTLLELPGRTAPLYMATHAHDCSNIGGFPEQNPRVNKFGTAVSLAADRQGRSRDAVRTGTSPASRRRPLLPWFPDVRRRHYTGQCQAGWTVTGNSQYVVYGGEFPRRQRHRAAGPGPLRRPALAPNKVGPRTTGDLDAVGAAMVTGARAGLLAGGRRPRQREPDLPGVPRQRDDRAGVRGRAALHAGGTCRPTPAPTPVPRPGRTATW